MLTTWSAARTISGSWVEARARRRPPDSQQPGPARVRGATASSRRSGSSADERFWFRPSAPGPRQPRRAAAGRPTVPDQVVPVVRPRPPSLGDACCGRHGPPAGMPPAPARSSTFFRRCQQRNQPVILLPARAAVRARGIVPASPVSPPRRPVSRGGARAGDPEAAGSCPTGLPVYRHPGRLASTDWLTRPLEDNGPAAFEAQAFGLQQSSCLLSSPMVPGSTRRSSTPPSRGCTVARSQAGTHAQSGGGSPCVPCRPRL